MVKSIEERKQKWNNFLADGGERTMYLIDSEASSSSASARPLPWPESINERIEWAYNNYCIQLGDTEWLADDRVPALMPYTGTEIFAEAFGCKVQYPKNDMPFAIPMYSTLSEAATLKVPDVHDTPLDNIFEIAKRLRQKAGSGAIMQLPDIQSPLDIAALILNKEEFYVSMSEEPQAIHEMIEKTKSLLTAFLDEWFSEFGHSYIAHFPTYYMEGGITLSEDEIGAFSAGMFDEFVRESLDGLSEKYGGIGIHCCADSEHQWQNLSKVKGLRLLNLINNPSFTKRSINFFRNSVALWPFNGQPISDIEPSWISNCTDDIRVVLTYKTQTRQSALETAKRAEELCEKRK